MPPKRKESETGVIAMSFVREGKTINYTVTQQQFDDIQHIKDNAPRINKETSDMCIDIEQGLKEIGIIAHVSTRPFRDLKENSGYEFLNPRNYLSNERVEVNIGGTVKTFFWGRYADLIDAKTKIIQSIQNGEQEPTKKESEVQRTQTEKPTRPKRATDTSVVPGGESMQFKSGDSGETDVRNIRLQLRVRKFQGDT